MKPRFFSGIEMEFSIIAQGLVLENDSIYAIMEERGFVSRTDISGPYSTVKKAVDAMMDIYCD